MMAATFWAVSMPPTTHTPASARPETTAAAAPAQPG